MSVPKVISEEAGSIIRLHWRLGNKIGGFEYHKPKSSRRSVPSAVTGRTVGQ
jgi:hypothetical protein